MQTIKNLNINSDFEYDFKLTRRNATTRATEAATGLTGVTGRFALTNNGAAIAGTEVALSEAGTTGRQVGVLDTAAMVTALTAYLGDIVYALPFKSGDILGEWQAYRVSDSHQMGT